MVTMAPIISTGLQPIADLLKEVTLKSNTSYGNPLALTSVAAIGNRTNITSNGKDESCVNH